MPGKLKDYESERSNKPCRQYRIQESFHPEHLRQRILLPCGGYQYAASVLMDQVATRKLTALKLTALTNKQ